MSEAQATPTAFNPLRMFRAPANWKQLGRPDIENGYFTTRRADVVNLTGRGAALAYHPGDITYLPNPTLELDIKLWENIDSPNNEATYIYFGLVEKGYQVALAKDFWITERLRMIWKKDGAGRLTFDGKANGLVMMWATGEEADKNELKTQALNRTVSQLAEETSSKLEESFGRMGIVGARVRVNDPRDGAN